MREKIRTALGLAEAMSGTETLQVFFRADDIGVVDTEFSQLMRLFSAHRVPLCLAVVPDWINRSSWETMKEFEPDSPLWCWHQHGWDHSNHEWQGKKCEFGPSRSPEAIRSDLYQGRLHLAQILGDLFLPVFTPPWNRCSLETLNILAELGFQAISRSTGAKPSAVGILSEFAVNVDLHTRREQEPSLGWRNLWQEMADAASTGRIGFMLHHQRMNEAAFAFLNLLLDELLLHPGVRCLSFRDLLAGGKSQVTNYK